MTRKILQSSLLIFLFSIVYFSNREMLLQDLTMKSLIISTANAVVLMTAFLYALRMIALFTLKKKNKNGTLTSTYTRNSF